MFLGVDLGGTGAKAGVFDREGRLLGFGRRSYGPRASPEGRAEVPIDAIYCGARDAAREAVSQAGVTVSGMAISSQGQTFVSLDEYDEPLHPAVIWYDSRAGAEADRLREAIAAARSDVDESPGPTVTVFCTAAKIMWLRRHEPELAAKACRYLLLPDYFSYRLTGVSVTDPNTASSTGLYAAGNEGYDAGALAAAGVEAEQMAEILPTGATIGALLPGPASEWGLTGDVVLTVGTNDQYSGALGAGNCRPGIVSETTGTCLALVTLTPSLPEPMAPGLLGGCFPIPGCHFVLAFAKTAGLVLDWFVDGFCGDNDLESMDAAAETVPIGAQGLNVLPHFEGTVSPVQNPAARGALCGIGLQHTPAHIHRAMLESLAFCFRENLGLIRDHGLAIDTVRAIGGGARSDLLVQMKADAANVAIERPAVTEAAILGAAMVAAVGTGAFGDLRSCSESLYTRGRLFEPDADRHAAYADAFARYRELKRRLYDEDPS